VAAARLLIIVSEPTEFWRLRYVSGRDFGGGGPALLELLEGPTGVGILTPRFSDHARQCFLAQDRVLRAPVGCHPSIGGGTCFSRPRQMRQCVHGRSFRSNGRLGSFGIFCPLGVDLNSHRSCNSTTVAKALSERIGETGKFPHP
jgi:hypothetical protein